VIRQIRCLTIPQPFSSPLSPCVGTRCSVVPPNFASVLERLALATSKKVCCYHAQRAALLSRQLEDETHLITIHLQSPLGEAAQGGYSALAYHRAFTGLGSLWAGTKRTRSRQRLYSSTMKDATLSSDLLYKCKQTCIYLR
jgi:hypothetical protein